MSRQQQYAIEPGQWQGDYLDSNGFRAKLLLDLDARPDGFAGNFTLRVRTEDEPALFNGRVEGVVAGERARLTWYRVANNKELEPIITEAHIRQAGSFARRTMMGIAEPVADSSFGGGVWIVWRFADRAER